MSRRITAIKEYSRLFEKPPEKGGEEISDNFQKWISTPAPVQDHEEAETLPSNPYRKPDVALEDLRVLMKEQARRLRRTHTELRNTAVPTNAYAHKALRPANASTYPYQYSFDFMWEAPRELPPLKITMNS